MNRHLFATFLSFSLALGLTMPAQAYPPKEWRFKVMLDDKPVGYHRFKLKLEQDGNQILQSEAEFNIRFLGFNAFRYQHLAKERWEQGCLVEIESQTSRNGQLTKLIGKRQNNEMILMRNGDEVVLPNCVMSFAYWDPLILKQSRLLNAETGEYQAIKVRSLGSESLDLSGKSVMAKRYRLETDKFSIDLWYGSGSQWLALQSKTEGDRNLRYVIDPANYSMQGRSRHA